MPNCQQCESRIQRGRYCRDCARDRAWGEEFDGEYEELTPTEDCPECGGRCWVFDGDGKREDCSECDGAGRVEVVADGGGTDDGEIDHESRVEIGSDTGQAWVIRARKNEDKWGIQHPEELLSAIAEEIGEIERAYLEATHEKGDPDEVEEEIWDLGPLLFQLIRSLAEHPNAYEPLPTAEEVADD
jgi:hypothetical protein